MYLFGAGKGKKGICIYISQINGNALAQDHFTVTRATTLCPFLFILFLVDTSLPIPYPDIVQNISLYEMFCFGYCKSYLS